MGPAPSQMEAASVLLRGALEGAGLLELWGCWDALWGWKPPEVEGVPGSRAGK